ncbi:MAG: hypothetical protein L3K14_04915 [Thermoplasmata archaeon]|nr:hypothetical protein [Thermoplasmata archaeon]
MDGRKFDSVIASASTLEERIAWFGALLARGGKTDIEIVGGSAIEIYLSSANYVSQDIDLVGPRDVIGPVLRKWGFRQVEGRSHRVYWFKPVLGLVDVVGVGDRSGLQPHRMETPYGPVLVSAVEPLIVRRLMRAQREEFNALYLQAVQLGRLGGLDWEYLETMAKFEGVASLLKKLRKDLKA